MKEINEQAERNKLLEEQQKLLKQKNEQDKLLKQQKNEQDKLLKQKNDEQKKLLEELTKIGEEYEEENILPNITFENIDSGPFVKFRTSALRRDIKNPTPSPSKISDPITKSCKPQGLAAGEQSTIEIMKNDLKVSKDIIEHFKKELNNTELLSQRYFEIKDKIIKEEYAALAIERKINEYKKDIERSMERKFRKYCLDKYYPYKK